MPPSAPPPLPLGGVPLPCVLAAEPTASSAKVAARGRSWTRHGARRYQVEEDLVVEANEASYDAVNGVYVFAKGVHATYGPTQLFADTLAVRGAPPILSLAPGAAPTLPEIETPPVEVDLGGTKVSLLAEEAYALGNVRILDPEGTVEAANFRFRWRLGARRGTAENLRAEIGSVKIRAGRAILEPERYSFFDVSGTACRERTPFLAASGPELTIVPGKRGRIAHPQLSILGYKLPAAPTLGFSLDNRTQGIRLPSLTYRREQGVGVSFGANRLFDESSQFVFNFAAFPNSSPSYGASYNRTTLAPTTPQGALTPVSDLDERFFFSWFENVYAGVPESDVEYLRQNRASFGAASLFNVSPVGRLRDDLLYTKALEGILERGGPMGGGGYRAQLRGSFFREGAGSFTPRLSLTTNYARVLATRGRLTSVGRFDLGLVGARTLFGFGGGEVGLAYRASDNVRFGASAFAYAEAGEAAFGLDRLAQPRGFSLRTDLNSAPTKFSLLLRYDGGLRQFDREYRFSQVVGCLEPVVVYREFPRTYQLGLRFRIDDLVGALQRRDPKRGSTRKNPYER